MLLWFLKMIKDVLKLFPFVSHSLDTSWSLQSVSDHLTHFLAEYRLLDWAANYFHSLIFLLCSSLNSCKLYYNTCKLAVKHSRHLHSDGSLEYDINRVFLLLYLLLIMNDDCYSHSLFNDITTPNVYSKQQNVTFSTAERDWSSKMMNSIAPPFCRSFVFPLESFLQSKVLVPFHLMAP